MAYFTDIFTIETWAAASERDYTVSGFAPPTATRGGYFQSTFEAVKVGDVLACYVKAPAKRWVGALRVESEMFIDQSDAAGAMTPKGGFAGIRPPDATSRQNEGVSTHTIEAPVRTKEPEPRDVPQDDRPWIVIVWNDPVNLMTYVTLVFRQLFGYTEAKATKLMLQVHNEGKAVVSGGTHEKAEYDVARLHAKGLWATMRQD